MEIICLVSVKGKRFYGFVDGFENSGVVWFVSFPTSIINNPKNLVRPFLSSFCISPFRPSVLSLYLSVSLALFQSRSHFCSLSNFANRCLVFRLTTFYPNHVLQPSVLDSILNKSAFLRCSLDSTGVRAGRISSVINGLICPR